MEPRVVDRSFGRFSANRLHLSPGTNQHGVSARCEHSTHFPEIWHDTSVDQQNAGGERTDLRLSDSKKVSTFGGYVKK